MQEGAKGNVENTKEQKGEEVNVRGGMEEVRLFYDE